MANYITSVFFSEVILIIISFRTQIYTLLISNPLGMKYQRAKKQIVQRFNAILLHDSAGH